MRNTAAIFLKKEGRDEGLAEYWGKTIREILIRGLGKRFSPLPDAVVSRIRTKASPRQLETWLFRIASAERLEDVGIE
jgi:hypothetical protein